jgi:hypothetical protein
VISAEVRPATAGLPPRTDVESRRGRWTLVAWAAAVALAVALPSRSPVASALTGETVPGVTLELSPGYLAAAPVLGVWDALAVLSIPQHLAVLGGLISIFLLWRLSRTRGARSRGFVAALAWETLALALFVGGVLVFYAVGAVIPRPMAALRVADPDVVVVDFHSHTLSSHDGRGSFTAERNRAWHRDSGYHVAFITDHDSVRAALDAAAANPRRAGAGTVILPGREVVYRQQHVAVLGLIDPRAILASAGDGSSVIDAQGRCPTWPVLVHTIPEDLDLVPVPECPDGAGGVHAIELIDGAPRGLGQGDRERERILAIADSLDLAVVASSNLHGWARTASGWSLLPIPGWRDMSPEQVGFLIEEKIRIEGRDAVEVIGRRRPVETEVGLAVAGLPIRFALDFLSQLGRAERMIWLLWLALASVATLRFGARRRDLSAAAR